MAAKKTKKPATKVTRAPKANAYNPHDSLIIQIGVIVIIVSGIALFAYAYAQYAIK
ncbi:MAG TPA: hypothetical protein PLS49_04710 [Candidatus Woesebacteria bacterium]|nr:hypothetical protein [Candidatus Woesebacteria bacterium]